MCGSPDAACCAEVPPPVQTTGHRCWCQPAPDYATGHLFSSSPFVRQAWEHDPRVMPPGIPGVGWSRQEPCPARHVPLGIAGWRADLCQGLPLPGSPQRDPRTHYYPGHALYGSLFLEAGYGGHFGGYYCARSGVAGFEWYKVDGNFSHNTGPFFRWMLDVGCAGRQGCVCV